VRCRIVTLALLALGTLAGMARPAERFDNDPVVVLIEDEEPTMTFDQWLDLIAADEPVDLGTSAADLLREAREAGEI
jgi:hypothetical protein